MARERFRRLVRSRYRSECPWRAGRNIFANRELLERNPLALEATLPRVLAAGDVRRGSIKRVASAVGEGSMAIALVHQLRESLGLNKLRR